MPRQNNLGFEPTHGCWHLIETKAKNKTEPDELCLLYCHNSTSDIEPVLTVDIHYHLQDT